MERSRSKVIFEFRGSLFTVRYYSNPNNCCPEVGSSFEQREKVQSSKENQITSGQILDRKRKPDLLIPRSNKAGYGSNNSFKSIFYFVYDKNVTTY